MFTLRRTLALGFAVAILGCEPVAGPDVSPSFQEIDIRPGSDFNPINPMSMGVIAVAILGSVGFDVADVDVTTLAFGPAGAPVLRQPVVLRDVNGDSFTDLVTHYRQQETGIVAGDTEACITGELLDGTPFEACDDVLIVGVGGPSFP
jgi:hypothetical protein